MDQDDLETPMPRPLVWMGDSKRRVQAFPERAKKRIGDELHLIQFGGMPRNATPFKGVGSGVFEFALRHDKEADKTVVAVQLGKRIYVLHAFQKKSETGLATSRCDTKLIDQRYAEAKELSHYDESSHDWN